MLYQAFSYHNGRQIRGWFATYPVVKVGVILGFLGVMGLVSGGIYLGARDYFRLVWGYEAVGTAMMAYIMNATVAVLLLLGIWLAVTNSLTALYKDQSLKQLLTLPITVRSWWVNQFMRMVTISAGSVMVVLFPLILAYAQIKEWGLTNWFWGGLALVMVVLISQTLGTLLTVTLTYRMGRGSGRWLIISSLGLLAGMALMIKLILPLRLFQIGEIRELESLPLASPGLPSVWLSQTIITGPTKWTGMAAGLTLGLSLLMFLVVNRYFLASWYKFQEREPRRETRKPSHFPIAWGVESALIVNDGLWLMRNTTERGYYLFIGGLGISLGLIIHMVPWAKEMEEVWKSAIYLSTLVGFGYLITIVATRLMYPLMAKEQRATWFLFSAPFPRQELISTKLTVSLALLIPWIGLGLILANQLALATPFAWLLGLLMTLMAVAIVVVNVTLGIIAPNFPEGERPDNASTSGSGLAALTLSLLLVAAIAWIWQRARQGILVGIEGWMGAIALGLGLLVWTAFIRIKTYENR